MYPEDRVLVAVMSHPKDLEIAHQKGWYRIPEHRIMPGIFFEYIAFYFTAAFGPQKWAIHYYARRLGHELVTRRDLLPEEPTHPRADERYYCIQLGPLQKREPPIVSRRWRRITFIHTTWDRFQAAQEINDLFVEGDPFVDRLYHVLREIDLAPERSVLVREAGTEYLVPLALLCRKGIVSIDVSGDEQKATPLFTLSFSPQSITSDLEECLQAIRAEVERQGGLSPLPA